MIDRLNGATSFDIARGLLYGRRRSFTRSTGQIVSRLYERLTKASRRRENNLPRRMREIYYRRGVYDAYKALQEELSR